MNKRGHKISVKTIEKWGERHSIPSRRILQLLDIARSAGRPIDINKYVLHAAPNAVEVISPNTDHEHKQKDV